VVKDVAEYLNVSQSTVYAWAASGYLPSISIGQGRSKCVRFRGKAVEKWLRNREVESKKNP